MAGSWDVLVTAVQVTAALAAVVLPRALWARAQHQRLWSLVSSEVDERP